QVDDAVDDVLIEPVERAAAEVREAHHRRVVELVDIILVEDERPGARERCLQAGGNGAAVLCVKEPGSEPAGAGDQDAADELKEQLGRATGVREWNALLRGEARQQPMLEARSMTTPGCRPAE